MPYLNIMEQEEVNSMKIQKTITIDGKLVEAIEKMAKEENRNFSNMVEVILQKAISEEKKS